MTTEVFFNTEELFQAKHIENGGINIMSVVPQINRRFLKWNNICIDFMWYIYGMLP